LRNYEEVRFKVALIVEGVRAIITTINNIQIDGESFKKAIKMYKLNHRDMVDNLPYSATVIERLKLLTVAMELLNFIEEHWLPGENIITPDELE